jgi:hypothetical protein
MDRHEEQAGPGWWSAEPLEGTPHRLRYRVGIVRGKHRVTHLCVEPDPDAPAAASAQGIRADDLRRIRPSQLLRESDAFWSALFDGDQAGVVAALVGTPKRWTAAELPMVRDLYVECVSATPPRHPRQELLRMGVKASTADRLIRRARERFPDDMGTAARGPASRKARP